MPYPYPRDYRYFAIESAWNNRYSAMESDGFSNYDLWMEYLNEQNAIQEAKYEEEDRMFAAAQEGDEEARKFIKKLIANDPVNNIKHKISSAKYF